MVSFPRILFGGQYFPLVRIVPFMLVREQLETHIFSNLSVSSSYVFPYAFSGCKGDSPPLSCLNVAFLKSNLSEELIR
jgi:hypothetical protein